MATDRNRVVVEEALCSRCFVPTKRVHHRHFPEVRAECNSVAEAAAHLSDRLAVYRDGAAGEWHRETIDLALQDVAEYLRALPAADRADVSDCRCCPQIPDVGEHALASPSPGVHADRGPARTGDR